MKKILATGLVTLATALSLGATLPAQSQTQCRWEGNQMLCNDQGNRNDRRYDDNRRYNDNRYDTRYNDNRYDTRYNDPWGNNNRYNNSSSARRAINDIYRQVLGRDADAGGMNTYLRNYSNGWTLEQIRRDIANSQEARNRRGWR